MIGERLGKYELNFLGSLSLRHWHFIFSGINLIIIRAPIILERSTKKFRIAPPAGFQDYFWRATD